MTIPIRVSIKAAGYVAAFCTLPFLFNLLGLDFASEKSPFDISTTSKLSKPQVIDSMFYTLRGSFTHTLLEWSAFCVAIMTAVLSFTHFKIKRDLITPIIGVSLLAAGCMDAFHTLAADRLIEATADNKNLIPFTWAICRLFNALILMVGVIILMAKGKDETRPQFILGVSLVFGLVAYAIIHFCAISANLPQTMYPNSMITRPWDVGPLLLYLVAGIWLFPKFYRAYPSYFSYSLLISLFPQIATQLHMAFGSTSLFDNHFNIAHFLKIIAYLIPFLGLLAEYIKTYRDEQEAEKRIRTILDSAREAIIVIDTSGTIRVFNNFAEQLFGYTQNEVMGRNVKILMPNPYTLEHDGYLKKYLTTGIKNIIGMTRELEGLKKNGSIFPMELGISEMKLGEEVSFVGNIKDITEAKNAERNILASKEEAEKANKNLIKSEAEIQAVVENVVDGIITISDIGIIEKFNSSAQTIFGYTLQEVMGKDITLVIPESYRSQHKQGLQVFQETGQAKIFGVTLELEGLHKNGTIFPLELAVNKLVLQDQTQFVGIVRNISDRKRAENELKAAEQSAKEKAEYQRLLANTAIIANEAISFDQAMEACLTNICDYFGWGVGHLLIVSGDRERVESLPIWHFSDTGDYSNFKRVSERKNFKKGEGLPGRVFENGQPEWIEDVLNDPNFPRKKFLTEKDGIRGGMGFPIYIRENIVAVMEFFHAKRIEKNPRLLDLLSTVGVQMGQVIERTRSEKELIAQKEEAEKANRAKSLFLANMSHEIRTPMNAVLGFSQILLRNKNLDEDSRAAVKTIDNSGKNLLNMINEILDISKIEAGKMELYSDNFELSTMIDHLSSLFELRCKQKQLRWTVEDISGPINVLGDEAKLRQVLVNLLGNAVKFTESGEVKFSISALENNQYRFDVIDTGYGIPLESHDKIFDAFQQDEEGAKKGGTGLGLAISKKQLELMGSDLHLKSDINEGAHFYFILTLPPGDGEILADKINLAPVLHLAPECKVKALVVDDVKENREVLAKLLLSIGVEVFEAKDGKEGVEKTKEHHPDIVFMDMRMPVMRGEDAVKLILEEFGKDRIKIVTITASALDRRREFYLDMGCHEFISKPFREEEIFNCLKQLLDVEFIYDDVEAPQEESSSIEELDLSQTSIPEDLHEKLKEYAEQYSITNLEKTLDELQSRNGTSKQLLAYLEQMVKIYDMEAIIKVLDSISKTKE